MSKNPSNGRARVLLLALGLCGGGAAYGGELTGLPAIPGARSLAGEWYLLVTNGLQPDYFGPQRPENFVLQPPADEPDVESTVVNIATYADRKEVCISELGDIEMKSAQCLIAYGSGSAAAVRSPLKADKALRTEVIALGTLPSDVATIACVQYMLNDERLFVHCGASVSSAQEAVDQP